MALIDTLPPALARTLERCPMTGERNVWLMQVASRARHVASPDRVRTFLYQIAAQQGWQDRDFSKEIDRAVSRAYGHTGPARSSSCRPTAAPRQKSTPWPEFDPAAFVVYSKHEILFELTAKSVDPSVILNALYADDELLCLAFDIRSASTMPRHNWHGKEPAMQFIVANPMTATIGRTQDGKLSARCLDIATTSRRYQVIEFDRGTPWEQAAILSSLHTEDRIPLIMVVWSGGKSMHGWFDVRALSENEKHDFFAWACTLGADPSLWDPCKLVRMPGGRRDNGKTQAVLDFCPQLLLGQPEPAEGLPKHFQS